MNSRIITESEVEQVALEILAGLGYQVVYGPDIAMDGLFSERQSYSDVVLAGRLENAIDKLNPDIPSGARDEAVKKVLRSESQNLVANNNAFHKMFVEGVDVEYKR